MHTDKIKELEKDLAAHEDKGFCGLAQEEDISPEQRRVSELKEVIKFLKKEREVWDQLQRLPEEPQVVRVATKKLKAKSSASQTPSPLKEIATDNAVSCLHIKAPLLYVGFHDGKIKVYDLTGNLIFGVSALEPHSPIAAFYSSPSIEDQAKRIEEIPPRTAMEDFLNRQLISMTRDGYIHQYGNKGELVPTDHSITCAAEFHERSLPSNGVYIGTSDGNILVYCLTSGIVTKFPFKVNIYRFYLYFNKKLIRFDCNSGIMQADSEILCLGIVEDQSSANEGVWLIVAARGMDVNLHDLCGRKMKLSISMLTVDRPLVSRIVASLDKVYLIAESSILQFNIGEKEPSICDDGN